MTSASRLVIKGREGLCAKKGLLHALKTCHAHSGTQTSLQTWAFECSKQGFHTYSFWVWLWSGEKSFSFTSGVACTLPREEYKVFWLFREETGTFVLGVCPGWYKQRDLHKSRGCCRQQEPVTTFLILRKSKSPSQRLKQSDENNQLTLKGEMTRVSHCCTAVFCLSRKSRNQKLGGNAFLGVSLLDV